MATRARALVLAGSAVAVGLVAGIAAGTPASASDTDFSGVDEVLVEEASGLGPRLFTDLEISAHDGFDRVVWEFAGAGEPGWFVEYSDDPREAGRGFRIQLDGEADLGVFIRGVDIPGEPGLPPDAVPYEEPLTPVPGVGTTVVTEVYPGLTFEGQQDAYIGLTHEVPFRVYRLADPARVVVELQHADPAPPATPPAEQDVSVFYGVGDGTDCRLVAPFERTVTGDDPILGAFDALVAGPTQAEIDAGASSFFSEETQKAVLDLDLDLADGALDVVLADLRQVIPNASSSCGSAHFLSELNSTAFQFPEVQSVRYAFEESCSDFYEFIQFGSECTPFQRPAEPTPDPTPSPTPSATATPTAVPTGIPTAVPAGEASPVRGPSGGGVPLWLLALGLTAGAGATVAVAVRARRG